MVDLSAVISDEELLEYMRTDSGDGSADDRASVGGGVAGQSSAESSIDAETLAELLEPSSPGSASSGQAGNSGSASGSDSGTGSAEDGGSEVGEEPAGPEAMNASMEVWTWGADSPQLPPRGDRAGVWQACHNRIASTQFVAEAGAVGTEVATPVADVLLAGLGASPAVRSPFGRSKPTAKPPSPVAPLDFDALNAAGGEDDDGGDPFGDSNENQPSFAQLLAAEDNPMPLGNEPRESVGDPVPLRRATMLPRPVRPGSGGNAGSGRRGVVGGVGGARGKKRGLRPPRASLIPAPVSAAAKDRQGGRRRDGRPSLLPPRGARGSGGADVSKRGSNKQRGARGGPKSRSGSATAPRRDSQAKRRPKSRGPPGGPKQRGRSKVNAPRLAKAAAGKKTSEASKVAGRRESRIGTGLKKPLQRRNLGNV